MCRAIENLWKNPLVFFHTEKILLEYLLQINRSDGNVENTSDISCNTQYIDIEMRYDMVMVGVADAHII